MSGLDKICKEIADEAAGEAQEILRAAKEKAAEIVAAAKAASGDKAARSLHEAEATVQDIARAQESAQTLQRRQRMLEAKQALLGETLNAAREELYALPETEYFALVAKLAGAAAEPGEGVLLLNEKDKARLPAGFEKTLAAALPKGAALTVGDATRTIDGGCILQYGDIELNCSFAAIFDARSEEFKDKIQDVLFQ